MQQQLQQKPDAPTGPVLVRATISDGYLYDVMHSHAETTRQLYDAVVNYFIPHMGWFWDATGALTKARLSSLFDPNFPWPDRTPEQERQLHIIRLWLLFTLIGLFPELKRAVMGLYRSPDIQKYRREAANVMLRECTKWAEADMRVAFSPLRSDQYTQASVYAMVTRRVKIARDTLVTGIVPSDPAPPDPQNTA